MGATYYPCMPPLVSPAPDLSTQVARLFFDRQLSKVEIASRLGISRFRVARLIDGALADGLVRIEYRDVPAEDRELAGTMEERFGLDLCAVAVATPASTSDVPRLAGAVLDGLIGDGDAIGIAWGSTLAAVVRAISPRRDTLTSVIQLAGSSSRLDRDGDAGELARVLADRLGGTAHPIFAPTFVETAALRTALLREPEVAGTAERFETLDLAIVGIGAMPGDAAGAASSLVRSGVLDPDELAGLTARGAVGDLVVHPFDAAGTFVAPELAERAIAIGVDDLRRTRRVIAVASGPRKARAIRGALATGIVRILVTDALTARAVLGAG
jgi:DNA-binding transcriptional regulator LsrR (DeoR family)